MSNEEFLRRLESALKNRVPQEDVDDAMNYHREYFAEAGEHAAEELPEPEAVAEQIVREREDYLRKRKSKWAKPAVVAALCVAVVVTIAVGLGSKIVFHNLWRRVTQTDDPVAVYEGDVIDQVTQEGFAGAGITTTETGDRVYVSGNLNPLESIVIEGVSDNVTITAAGTEFWLDIDSDRRENLDWSVQDGTLYINADMDGIVSMDYEGGTINITVPQDSWRSMIRVETDLGNICLEGVNAGEVELDTDLGDITVSNGNFNSLDCDSDMGNVDVTSVTADALTCYCDCGNVTVADFTANETDLESNLGNVEAIATGERSDYSMELQVDLGEIKVNGQKVSNPYVTNGARYVLKAEADMGNVTVDFAQQSSVPAPPAVPAPPEPPTVF